MKHIYILVYKGFKNGYCRVEGNTEMLCSKLIDSIADIRGLERLILSNSQIDGVDIDTIVITWYNLLQTREFEVEESEVL